MPYSTHLLLALATLVSCKCDSQASEDEQQGHDLQEVLTPVLERVYQLVERFRQQRVMPTETYRFEEQVEEELRELGRVLLQWTYNQLEPAVGYLAKHVRFEAGQYTRLNQKTPQHAW